MLHLLRRLFRLLYRLPVVGGRLQRAVTALRLPTLQRRQVELAARQKRADEAALRDSSALWTHFGQTNAQVAQLAERLAAVEAVLARIDIAAQENLVMSAPVALRRSARDIARLRAQIGPAPCAVLDGSARENA